jgi:hypothetical protein
MKSARPTQSPAETPQHPLGQDPEFEQALDAFAEAAKSTLEEMFKGKLNALEERITALSERAANMPALLKRATTAEQRVESLERELKTANDAARTRGPQAGTRINPPATGATPARPKRPEAKPPARLPSKPTLQDVIAFLGERGFSLENHRPSGGHVWVFSNEEQFASVRMELKSAGIRVIYHPRGRPLKPVPQFQIDPEKGLTDSL